MVREPPYLKKALKKKEKKNTYRQLPHHTNKIDFCSNDYLGLARSPLLQNKVESHFQAQDYYLGATGSRLISGNSCFIENLEKEIAHFHQASAGLIFNSGYTANLALLSTLPQRHDTIIYDEYVHASIRDGIQLSWARSYKFVHNQLSSLEKQLKKARGNIFIVVESVYSMKGDKAPLTAIVRLAKQYNAYVILDEAHSTGIWGAAGEGRGVEEGVCKEITARLHTFSKALGVHGAIVVGSTTLRRFLINFARPFIYTTALPYHTLLAVKHSYSLMKKANDSRCRLHSLIAYFQEKSQQLNQLRFFESSTPIQICTIPGKKHVKEVTHHLQEKGFAVQPILPPTVPVGKECIRISLHSFNTMDQIDRLLEELQKANT